MPSFYGTTLAAGNRVSFQFDKTYASRYAMDRECEQDGVFLGRYVLVEYDEDPIRGYYNGYDFFTTPAFVASSKIERRAGVIYQNLAQTGIRAFFTYDPANDVYVEVNDQSASPYTLSYMTDVQQYGRGYDSTAWVKTYDTSGETPKYRYVMVAELNTIVPTFHLAVDPPTYQPTAPYFDSSTTNVDYYLHAQASYADYIHELQDNTHSDLQIMQGKVNWNTLESGQTYTTINPRLVNADVYFNKRGFNKNLHVKSDSDDNSIGFDYEVSGRQYYNTVSRTGVWSGGTTAEDMRAWHIRLPALGDAVCDLYDFMYGYDETTGVRNTKLATSRGDIDAPYTPNSALGTVNMLRDLMGYLREKHTNQQVGSTITYTETDTHTLFYDTGDGTTTNADTPVKYYYYKYSPAYKIGVLHKPENGDPYLTYSLGSNELNNGDSATTRTVYEEDIFVLEDGVYKKPNLGLYNDGNNTDLYAAIPRWVFAEMQVNVEDTLSGILVKIVQELGGDANARDNTLRGLVNQVKDLCNGLGREYEQRIATLEQQYANIASNEALIQAIVNRIDDDHIADIADTIVTQRLAEQNQGGN